VIGPLLAGGALAAAALFSFRHAWWRRPVPWSEPRVLMYHMVSAHRKGARFNKLRVSPELFARQLEWLGEHGFTYLFASRLFAPEPLPERSVCLTFDDGYLDNLLGADPLLAEHDARATLYLVAEREGGWSSYKKAGHDDAELQSEPKLGDDQVAGMVAGGRWEIGGHGRRHALLTALPDAEARAEIDAPCSAFAERFGVRPATFAYPFGIFADSHAAMVRDSGFVGAVTTEPGIAPWPYADPLRVPRIKVSGKEGMLGFVMRLRGGRRGLLK